MPALIPGGQRQAIVLDGKPLEEFDKLKKLANGSIDICLWSQREVATSTKEKVMYFVLLYGCESSIKGYSKCSTATTCVTVYI